MRLIADSGLWSTGPQVEPTPVTAVLEVSGALLSWTVDDASDTTAITFTDPSRADWLWRVLGESGHAAVAAALDGRTPDATQTIEVSGVGLLPGSVDRLRRLALGHWLRRWWPASHRDGIAALDGALLDAEIALLTAGVEEFFTDDTVDSDVEGLLRPHAAALTAHVQGGDPRVLELLRACTDLADDVGVALDAVVAPAAARRDDYALAAGSDTARGGGGAIATGTASLNWGGVPPGVFDAAENTVAWRIDAVDGVAKAVVQAELSGTGLASGIAVSLRSGGLAGSGVLDAEGGATLALVDAQQQPVTESVGWNHDWRATSITIGTDVQESQQTRDRVRQFARTRLDTVGSDAFLAEVLAAESDY
jgi:hypothetical protein